MWGCLCRSWLDAMIPERAARNDTSGTRHQIYQQNRLSSPGAQACCLGQERNRQSESPRYLQMIPPWRHAKKW